MLENKRILVAPLNWGLGHASRCVPIINRLTAAGAEVVLGLDGKAGTWLQKRYPENECVAIPGYEVIYSKGNSQVWAMAAQLPGLMYSIEKEHSLLHEFISKQRIDAVISDQRFGLHTEAVPSIIITHQVNPVTPIGQRVFRKKNLNWLGAFDRVWIVDDPKLKLAGDLSTSHSELSYSFVGAQSRFNDLTAKPSDQYTCVGLVSGPEPHRELLVNILLKQFKEIDGEHLLLIGNPKIGSQQDGNVLLAGDMSDETLLPHLLGCALIVTRSGYSSIMDLHAIGRPALLIPTPGQPEQEYLGEQIRSGAFHHVQVQHAVDVSSAMVLVRTANGFSLKNNTNQLVQALHDLAAMMNG